MKVNLYNYFDPFGGAGRATWRIFHALKKEGIDASLNIVKAMSTSDEIFIPEGKMFQVMSDVRRKVGELPLHFFKTNNYNQHSLSFLPSQWPALINRSDADIIQLHWVNYEMMSVEDIGQINKPVVWRLSDMWAFAGAEYYTDEIRYREGYTKNNRPDLERGIDFNRWVWNRKKKAWKKPMHIIAPSNWMAECVKQSALMHDWPVTFIPNAIDTDDWRPVERILARRHLGLPEEGILLCFGAIGGAKNPRKGSDLLFSAINYLRGEIPNLKLVVFGEKTPEKIPDIGFPIHYMGHLDEDSSLKLLYSAVNALVIPSRLDNSPNTGVECLSCGTPVVGFNCTGLPDIITHKKNGWLAKAFDTEDMANGIKWILNSDEEHQKSLRVSARNFALNNFSYSVVANQYKAVYDKILSE